MNVTVEATWREVGEIRLEGKQLVFPAVPTQPGIYRFRFETAAGAFSSYIGEAANLIRRHAGYQYGYKKQLTNFRINGRMKEHLAVGGRIVVSISTEATVTIDGATRPLDLGLKRSRLLVENAALHALPNAEPIENQPGVGEAADLPAG